MTENKAAFEVHYTNDAEKLTAFYKATICRGATKKGILILILGCILLGIIVAAMTGAVQLNLTRMMTISIILMDIAVLVAGVLMLVYHKLMAKTAFKNGVKHHNGQMPKTDIVFAGRINITEGGTKTVYHYGDVTNFRENAKNYFLMFGKYAGVILPKDSFSVGDANAFKEWIYQKAPRLRLGMK